MAPDVAAGRLAALRGELARQGMDGFIVPVADPHLGEYMPAHDRRLEWLTGFSGSAGLAVVLAADDADGAIVFSDGRYTLQLAQETAASVWQRGHLVETPPAEWLARRLAGRSDAAAIRIGYDPRLISDEALERYTGRGIGMVAVADNPVDAVWDEQPAPPVAPVAIQAAAQSGRDAADKRAAVAAQLRADGADAAVLSDPASINWLLNIRGGDVAFTPFALGFAVIDAEAQVSLFIDAAKLGDEARVWLGNEVAVQPPSALPAALAGFGGKRVRVDPAGTSAWFGQTLRAAGAIVVDGSDPCLLPKACKNPTEQAGARAAHRRDGVALCRFLHAMDVGEEHTEMSAAALLDRLRGEDPAYRGESFPAISGAGEHGAIIHYRVTAQSDRRLGHDEVYLIDSGGQYADGTTDVTRTLWTGPGPAPERLRGHYTRVLAGHLELGAAVFPAGVAGPHLDALARTSLWQAGLDYDHGTGHGVGSYLSVHEGPASFHRSSKPVPLAEGMILSNEPGYYLPGAYGIRIENLMLVRTADVGGTRPFLCFETLTLAPYARALIEPALLSPAQVARVDAYHARVLAAVGPLVPAATAAWLGVACAPLADGHA